MTTSPPKIAFAGLGAMGYGMASHLVKSGYHVTAFDIYQPSLDRFSNENKAASVAKTPRGAVQDADFLIIMVATSVQANPLLFDQDTGAVQALKQNATIIMTSTVAPAYITELQTLLAEQNRKDVKLIDSPVSGGSIRAADGTLSIFASANDPLSSSARDILQTMSAPKKLYELGELGNGSKAKLIHQVFAGVNIAATSEVLGLAALAGWDTKAAYEALKNGEGGSWMFGHRGGYMLDNKEGEKARYSAITIIAKDVAIITSTARPLNHPLPLLSTAEQLFLHALSAGWGPEDDCVLVRLYIPHSPNLVASSASSPSTQNPSISLDSLAHLLTAIHVAAAAEAMSLSTLLQLPESTIFDIVSNAAGSSAAFSNYFEELREQGWRLRGEKLGGVGGRLGEVVQSVRGGGEEVRRYPLFLAERALGEWMRDGLQKKITKHHV